MTFGVSMPQPEKKLVRLQEKGQVTLPAEVRRALGLKKGDLVAVTQTEDGVLITPTTVVANRALDRIGEILRSQGASLEDLMEAGRDIRGELTDEEYGRSGAD
jgi:AbrB family looped-hinge helix DNA binding protein